VTREAANDPVLLLALFYFLPTIVALVRGHLSAAAIAILNLLLGWTVVGWIVALVWSFSGDTKANRLRFARPTFTERPIEVVPPEPPPRRALPPPPIATTDWGAPLERHESRSRSGEYYYRNATPLAFSALPYVKDRGLFEYVAHGAAYHTEALERLAGGWREASVYFHSACLLRPEPDNPHDPEAVAIIIAEELVGYLAAGGDNRAFLAWREEHGIDGDVQTRALIELPGPRSAERKAWLRLDIAFPLPAPTLR
jgi:hypothetical protein